MAEQILAQAKQLDAFISVKGLEMPSLDQDSLSTVHLPEELQSVRSAMINNASDFRKIAMGSVANGSELAFGVRLFLSTPKDGNGFIILYQRSGLIH